MGSHVLQHLDRGEPALPSAAKSPGGFGSPYRPVQHNTVKGGGVGCSPWPSRRQPPCWAGTKSLLQCFSKSSRELGALREDSKKMAAASVEAVERGGTDSSNRKTAPDLKQNRQCCPLLIRKDPLFLLGPSG